VGHNTLVSTLLTQSLTRWRYLQSSLLWASAFSIGQAETLYAQGTLGCTPPTYINHHDKIQRGFEADVFTGHTPCWMPFLTSNWPHLIYKKLFQHCSFLSQTFRCSQQSSSQYTQICHYTAAPMQDHSCRSCIAYIIPFSNMQIFHSWPLYLFGEHNSNTHYICQKKQNNDIKNNKNNNNIKKLQERTAHIHAVHTNENTCINQSIVPPLWIKVPERKRYKWQRFFQKKIWKRQTKIQVQRVNAELHCQSINSSHY